jgi:hypothetical protein
MECLIKEMKRQTQICIRKVVHTSFCFSARCSNQKIKPKASLQRAAVQGVLVLLQHMKRKAFCVDAMVKNRHAFVITSSHYYQDPLKVLQCVGPHIILCSASRSS